MCSIRILVYNEVNCPAQGACLQGDDPINAKVSAAYACGRHHTLTGTPCQDRTAGFVRGALAGVVLCDGAGSCAHSERAAQRLMEWIPDYLQITFDTLCALPPEEAAATVAAAGQAALEVLGMPPEECYCTLLFYAAHADGRWLCGHIGDGYIFRIRQDTAVVFSAPETGSAATDRFVSGIMDALNRYTADLAKEQIRLAFAQAQKEVDDLHQRTREGILTARLNGKQIGQTPGRKLTIKKSAPCKEQIKKYSRDFDGTLTDADCIKLIGIARNTYYKYKRELREELTRNMES